MKENEQDRKNGKPWGEIEMKLRVWCNGGSSPDQIELTPCQETWSQPNERGRERFKGLPAPTLKRKESEKQRTMTKKVRGREKLQGFLSYEREKQILSKRKFYFLTFRQLNLRSFTLKKKIEDQQNMK